jgi:hypothetical protein
MLSSLIAVPHLCRYDILQVILQVPGVTPQAVQQFEIQLKDATGAKVGTVPYIHVVLSYAIVIEEISF